MKTLPLKAMCTDGGQYGLNIAASEYTDSGVQLLRTTDLSGARADVEPVFVPGPIEACYRLEPGDILLTRSGSVGVAHRVEERHASATFAGFLVRFRPRRDVDSRFIYYVTQSHGFQQTIQAEAISSTITNFNADRYANIKVPSPASETQRRIADFLDDECGRLDTLVDATAEQLARLARRWNATAAHLLANGDNGIEIPLKHLTSKIGSGKTPSGGADAYVSEGVLFLRSQNVHRLELRLDDVAYIDAATDADMAGTRVRDHDVLLCITGGSLGRAAVAQPGLGRANVSQHVCIIRLRHGWEPLLVAAAINGSFVQEQISSLQVGGNREGLNFEQVGSLRLRIPPPEEHAQVLPRLMEALEQAAEAKQHVKRRAALLEERKRALITACVTGEFDISTASERVGTAAIQGVTP